MECDATSVGAGIREQREHSVRGYVKYVRRLESRQTREDPADQLDRYWIDCLLSIDRSRRPLDGWRRAQLARSHRRTSCLLALNEETLFRPQAKVRDMLYSDSLECRFETFGLIQRDREVPLERLLSEGHRAD